MDKRIFAVIAIAIAALTLGAMLGSGVGHVSVTETPTFSGDLLVAVESESGTVTYEVKNLVVTIGKTRVKDYLRVGTAAADDPVDYISLSNDVTPLITWTQLPTEIAADGLTRAQGTVTNVDEVEFTVSHKFTCTGTGVAVQCSGLQWAASGDSNLWAAATFTATTLNNGDNITITWTVTHN
ncbi:MAG: hypothetical protein HWN68_10825 [Desulfobacterales bacterium]|nr:hypothetical protein [Desulfobacterales bacterium]